MKELHNCVVCREELRGKQLKFCSAKCKNSTYQSYQTQRQRALSRKLEFVRMLGGRCAECGYDKNLAVLSFHHRSPRHKEFDLDSRSISNRKRSALLKELKKCDLLCANCHLEEHNPRLNMAQLTAS